VIVKSGYGRKGQEGEKKKEIKKRVGKESLEKKKGQKYRRRKEWTQELSSSKTCKNLEGHEFKEIPTKGPRISQRKHGEETGAGAGVKKKWGNPRMGPKSY